MSFACNMYYVSEYSTHSQIDLFLPPGSVIMVAIGLSEKHNIMQIGSYNMA